MKKKVSVLKAMGLILSVVCMSCAGGNVSHNGLFEDDHKALKASLVGSWEVTSAGKSLYEFYKENKEIKLRVKGVDTLMERFDSPDGLTFSFLYKDQEGKDIFVLGQFKSYLRQEFIAVEEGSALVEDKLVFNLKRRVRPVVVEAQQEVDQDGSLRN